MLKAFKWLFHAWNFKGLTDLVFPHIPIMQNTTKTLSFIIVEKSFWIFALLKLCKFVWISNPHRLPLQQRANKNHQKWIRMFTSCLLLTRVNNLSKLISQWKLDLAFLRRFVNKKHEWFLEFDLRLNTPKVFQFALQVLLTNYSYSWAFHADPHRKHFYFPLKNNIKTFPPSVHPCKSSRIHFQPLWA